MSSYALLWIPQSADAERDSQVHKTTATIIAHIIVPAGFFIIVGYGCKKKPISSMESQFWHKRTWFIFYLFFFLMRAPATIGHEMNM